MLLFCFSLQANETNIEITTRSSYVVIPINKSGDSVAGKLSFPIKNNNGAAILIVHGTNGLDSRGEFHSQALNQQGYTTLEIDLWARRGWFWKYSWPPKNRSRNVT